MRGVGMGRFRLLDSAKQIKAVRGAMVLRSPSSRVPLDSISPKSRASMSAIAVWRFMTSMAKTASSFLK